MDIRTEVKISSHI